MVKYNFFVESMVQCILASFRDIPCSLSAVAQGGEEYENCTTQDYADLKGVRAELFGAVIHNQATVFQIEPEQFQVIEYLSVLSGDRKKKYIHSCYPKNLRRWMDGTLPRKKKCRIELVALIACWASGWTYELSQEETYVECRKKIGKVCSEILKKEMEEMDFESMRALTELLWKTSEVVYYKKKTES